MRFADTRDDDQALVAMRRQRWARLWALGIMSLCDVRDIIMTVAPLSSYHGGLYARCVRTYYALLRSAMRNVDVALTMYGIPV